MIIIITIVIIMYLDGNERSVVVAASVGEIGGGKTWDGRESKLLHFIRHIQAQYNYRGNKTLIIMKCLPWFSGKYVRLSASWSAAYLRHTLLHSNIDEIANECLPTLFR